MRVWKYLMEVQETVILLDNRRVKKRTQSVWVKRSKELKSTLENDFYTEMCKDTIF